MTATILFVRHAVHADLGRVLSGRSGDVPLSAEGNEGARRLAARLGAERIDRIDTSPVRRARETAEAIGAARGMSPETAAPLDEIDFGEWSGKAFTDLEPDPRWREWNAHRGSAATPGGETMAAVQERVLAHLREAARTMSGKVVAMVSHADVIRAAVAGVIGLPLDRILSFAVEPASVTRIAAGEWGERLLTLNESGS
ncbi:MAG: histidine phosphatase family protein [Porphyrobacter sp.]|nr:histidine phosphatase family protein [Porphyrobacter sp.]